MMKIPKHVGIIPDGNRRWAKQRGLRKEEGYAHGLEPGVRLMRLAKRLGVEELSFYGFTVDNCKRPHEQVTAFQSACVEAVQRISGDGAELLVMGNSHSKCFPEELLPYTVRKTIGTGGIKLNFLVNYGWEWDLSNMSLENRPHSYDISRVDLVIRWGGMRRLSGFLPIQSVYADFYVEDKLWPDYADEDVFRALEWYARQDVTLGG
jgi:undecaprenyl diphosphate synthase